MTTNSSVLKALKKTPNFRTFPDEGLLKLIEVGQILEFNKKDAIYKQTGIEKNVSEINESFFIIVKGCVDVLVTENEKEIYLCTLGDGELIGETGMFPGMGRLDSVIPVENTTLLEIKRENFMKFLKEYQSSSNQILLITISCLIKKLNRTNLDLAYERRNDIAQSAIDEMISQITE